MLHIVFLLLKIVGILLALLLFLIVVVLAAPIRYSFRLEKKEDSAAQGQIKVTWLFHLIYAKAGYIEEKLDYRVRIFGYQIMGNQEEFLDKKRIKQEKKKEKEDRKRKKEKQADTSQNSVKVSDARQAETVSEPMRVDTGDTSPESEENLEREILEELEKEAETVKKKPSRLLSRKNSSKKSDKAKKKTDDSKIMSKLSAIKAFASKIKNIYVEYHGEQLLSFAKNSIVSVIKHIFPRRLSGRIRFGLDDPADTGMLTGAVAMLYPRLTESFTLEPDFQELCFEADCAGKGRIHLGFFLYMLIKIFMNRDARMLIKRMLRGAPQ